MLKGLEKVFSGKNRVICILAAIVIVGVVVFECKWGVFSAGDRNFSRFARAAYEKQPMMKANSYRASGRYWMAVRAYRGVAKKHPDVAPAAYYEIAQTYSLSGSRDSKKIKAYQEVIQKFPDSEEAGKALDGLRRCQPFKNKKTFYGDIISQYPDNKISAMALEALAKSSEDQTPLYQDLIRKYPDKYIAEAALAQMLNKVLAQQSSEDAQKFCLKCLVEHPNNKIQIAAYKQLVAYAQQSGNLQPVIDFSNALVKDYPNTPLTEVATLTLADINFQKGNYIESLRLRSSLEKKNGK